METNKNYLSISNINKKVFRCTFLLYEIGNLNYVNEYDKINICNVVSVFRKRGTLC